jgi:hypothetical protein
MRSIRRDRAAQGTGRAHGSVVIADAGTSRSDETRVTVTSAQVNRAEAAIAHETLTRRRTLGAHRLAPSMLSFLYDEILMPLPEQSNDLTRTINKHSK